MDGTSGIILGSLVSTILCCCVVLAWFTVEDRHFHCIPANGYDSLIQDNIPIRAIPSDMRAKRVQGYKMTAAGEKLNGRWALIYEKGR